MDLDTRITALERKQSDTKQAIAILATAISVRSDRNVTLDNEAIGTTIDLLSDGHVSDAVNYYNQTRPHS